MRGVEAIIQEAHKNNVRVHAHATTIDDQKDALRAGADVLVHLVQNAPIDDELAALVVPAPEKHAPTITCWPRSSAEAERAIARPRTSRDSARGRKPTPCARVYRASPCAYQAPLKDKGQEQ
jgi:imidazolonepropionase-like amidohydrolase